MGLNALTLALCASRTGHKERMIRKDALTLALSPGARERAR
jgi:hypothetical protein